MTSWLSQRGPNWGEPYPMIGEFTGCVEKIRCLCSDGDGRHLHWCGRKGRYEAGGLKWCYQHAKQHGYDGPRYMPKRRAVQPSAQCSHCNGVGQIHHTSCGWCECDADNSSSALKEIT